jgi:hypothetical protein
MQYFIAIKSKDDCNEALEAARRHSPNIEIVDERTLVFDLTGSKTNEAARIAGELRKEFEAVAVAENLAAVLLLVRWGRKEFQVQGSKFKVRNVEVEAKETSSKKQTQNSKPKTQNSALNLEPGTLNSASDEPGTLNGLPLDAVSDKAEFLELMDSWAIHDLGAFSQLPEDEMVARFGLEIIELKKQALGEAFRAVNWNVKEDKFFWAKEMEGGIETIEPLNFVLTKGVAQIFQNLDYVGLSTQSAKITLCGRRKKKIYRIRIVFPTKNQKIWIRQIVTNIELDTPLFNIDYVEIEFRSTKPRTVQNNLYSGAILEPENLNLIVSKLKKVVGLKDIGLPKLRDSWSEEFYMSEDISPLIKEEQFKVQGSKFKVCKTDGEAKETSSNRQTQNSKPKTQNPTLNSASDEPASEALVPTFYYLPQPVKVRVFFESGEPKALLIKGKREMVRTSGGPWRKDAEWYKAKGWKRDEWDIETETGAVYRVFTDKNGEAFVDGGYD